MAASARQDRHDARYFILLYSIILGDMMDKIINQLIKIKENPIIYFGNKSLSQLYAYIEGYQMCLYENCEGMSETKFTEFRLFLNGKFYCSPAQGWATVILNNSEDEEAAFDTFYRLFNEFLLK